MEGRTLRHEFALARRNSVPCARPVPRLLCPAPVPIRSG
jgi:hypothetical protein